MEGNMFSILRDIETNIQDAVSYISKVNKLNLGVYELIEGKDYPYHIELQKKSVTSDRAVELPLLDMPKDAIKCEWDEALVKQLKPQLEQNAADKYIQGIIKKE